MYVRRPIYGQLAQRSTDLVGPHGGRLFQSLTSTTGMVAVNHTWDRRQKQIQVTCVARSL